MNLPRRPNRIFGALLGLLGLVIILVILFAQGVAAQQSQGVPPRVALFDTPGEVTRDLWITVNNPAAVVEARHYAAADDPATQGPRHTCVWQNPRSGSYQGGALLCRHFYSDAQPDDEYYIAETWLDETRIWGPYRLTDGPLADGPQPETVFLPALTR